uniref:EGF-like domain-containing protein n=1 Tax=Setaria digitata TaxID=48799 RepID=A0A915Q0F0_9BILA
MMVLSVIILRVIDLARSSRRRNFRNNICENGSIVGGRCVCMNGYSGTYCNRVMHCKFNKLQPNGSCLDCIDGWEGINCDHIQCINGVPDATGQYCLCEKPYGGKFCTTLQTSDVYSYYNHKVYKFGPIGALLILPLVLILYGCERTAQFRRIKRVEEHLHRQNVIVNRHKISNFLTTKLICSGY